MPLDHLMCPAAGAAFLLFETRTLASPPRRALRGEAAHTAGLGGGSRQVPVAALSVLYIATSGNRSRVPRAREPASAAAERAVVPLLASASTQNDAHNPTGTPPPSPSERRARRLARCAQNPTERRPPPPPPAFFLSASRGERARPRLSRSRPRPRSHVAAAAGGHCLVDAFEALLELREALRAALLA